MNRGSQEGSTNDVALCGVYGAAHVAQDKVVPKRPRSKAPETKQFRTEKKKVDRRHVKTARGVNIAAAVVVE